LLQGGGKMYAKLNKLLNGSKSGEKGAALILALILVAVGSLMVLPLLNFIGSSYMTTDRVYDEKAKELYAADAGARAALLRIQKGDRLPEIGSILRSEPDDIENPINGKEVYYEISKINPEPFGAAEVYEIASYAGNTSITTHTLIVDFFKTFTRNAITSPGTFETKKSNEISGIVQASNGDNNYTPIDGFISAILITNGGSGYNPANPPVIDINPKKNAAAIAIVKDQVITGINIIDGGSGYTSPVVTITDSTGSGAKALAIVSDGTITEIKVLKGGSNYSFSPTIDISDPTGSGAKFSATVENGVVTGAIMNAGGEGYVAPLITFIDNKGKNATATAVVNGGKIVDIILTDGGYGYSPGTTVAIEGGEGTGASAHAVIVEGEIIDVVVDAQGIGYTSPTVSIIDVSSQTASAKAVLGNGQDKDKIVSITLVNPGSGYDPANPPSVTISSSPGGNNASAEIVGIMDGKITAINITNSGSGYTTAPVVLIDPPPAATGSGATAITTVMNSDAPSVDSAEIKNFWPSNPDNPGTNMVQEYYFKQVKNLGLAPITNDRVVLNNTSGPLYLAPASGTVTLDTNGEEVTLADTTGDRILYVDGIIEFAKDSNLNLNGYTIFSTSNDDAAIYFRTNIEFGGPGALIANGGINFQPNLSNSQYIYIMSLNKTVNMQPSKGNFVGSIAGNVFVNLQPNCTITWADPSDLNINLPGGEEHELLFDSIADWIIK
jgi:hypothetical protein